MVTENIIEDGGEGIILRKVGSYFQHGRTNDLIKLKVCRGRGGGRKERGENWFNRALIGDSSG